MLIRWVVRFVAMFLGRKAWEALQRRRTATRRAPSTYAGTAGGPSGDGRSGRSRA